MQFPRILVIGPNVFNERVGAGITLTGLFGGWPLERLAQVHSDNQLPNQQICRRYYRLNRWEATPMSTLHRQLVRVPHFLSGNGEEAPIFIGGRLTPRLLNWLEQFQPEAVFSQLGGLAMAQITLAIVRRYRIPLAVHISDDWVPGWPANVLGRDVFPVTHLANLRMRRVFVRLLGEAHLRLSIAESMSQEYRARYGLEFTPFYNAVDPADWPERLPAPFLPGQPVRLVYSGSVFRYAQFGALCDLRDAVLRLNAEGLRVRLEIFTQHWREESQRAALERPPHVQLFDLVPRERLQQNLSSADMLVLPVAFDSTSISFIRYSMPGKMAEYLMSGTPVLAYGPVEVAQIEFASEHGCAEVVSQRNQALLVGAIRGLTVDHASRVRLSQRARAVAMEHFNLPVQRARFQSLMSAMVERGGHGLPCDPRRLNQ